MFPTARFKIILLLVLSGISLILSSCQEIALLPPVTAPVSQTANPVTETPFQAMSPTPQPTVTVTPTPAPTLTPTLIPTATIPPCLDQQGQVTRQEAEFVEGAPPLGFQVYLPPCFDPSGETRYPVLYMIHGQSFKDDQWVRLGIAEAADELINQKISPPFIIVMPNEANTYADIYDTPFPASVVDGLIPWIDNQYPTCTERACRAIGGLSRGGAWALHLGFTRWDLFGSVGLHSTPPFVGDPDRFPGWLKSIPLDQLPRIYMDTGKQDYWRAFTIQFEEQLVNLQVPHEWYVFTGAHDEVYWSAHVADYLMWYTQPWQSMEGFN